MNRCNILLAATALSLPGCATTSFAPPSVSLPRTMSAGSLDRHCAFVSNNDVTTDVDGALKLIVNYVAAYRCARDVAANGRQLFQLPSFIALAGAAAAAAFGAPPDVAIAGGVVNQVFTSGNNYYAPVEQAQILRDAVDAMNCINSEAVGMTAMTRLQRVSATLSTPAGRTMLGIGIGGSTVQVTAERRYFNMVASALLAVENTAAQRLSRRGTFDAAGIAAQIEQLAKKIRDQQTAADHANLLSEQSAAAVRTAAQTPGITAALLRQALRTEALADANAADLDLSVLQPKLDQCALRAQV